MIIQLILWCSLAGLAYIYAGYPALVWLLARTRSRALQKGTVTDKVSVVVVAHNEAPALAKKLDSIFASHADRQIDEVVIASDGSTDDTANVIRNYGDPPSFYAVANDLAVTETALKVLLRTPHARMPNFMLGEDQTAAIVDYILSLRPH